jgi:hypothetical protein
VVAEKNRLRGREVVDRESYEGLRDDLTLFVSLNRARASTVEAFALKRTTLVSHNSMKKTERTPRTQQEAESEQAELLELHEIKELVELIAAKEFTEFELVRGRFKLRLRKGGAADPVVLVSPNIPGEAGETVPGAVRASEQAATPPATATRHRLHPRRTCMSSPRRSQAPSTGRQRQLPGIRKRR